MSPIDELPTIPTVEQLDALLAEPSSQWPESVLGEYFDGGLSKPQRSLFEQEVQSNAAFQKRWQAYSENVTKRRSAFLDGLLANSSKGKPEKEAKVVDLATARSHIVIETMAAKDSPLFVAPKLSIAASEVRGGVVQANDRQGRVTMAVEQVIESSDEKSWLEIRVLAPNKALHSAKGTFELVVQDEVQQRLDVTLVRGRFIGLLPLRKLSVDPSQVKYRLTLDVQK